MENQFRQTSWCKDLLDKPDVVIFVPTSREQPNGSGQRTSQDQLFYQSLFNETAVPYNIGFYQKPAKTSTSKPEGKSFLVQSASLLFDLREGVNGYNGCVHGGLIAAMMDEAMGNVISINNDLNEQMQASGQKLPDHAIDMSKLAFYTTGINMRLQRPIRTPHVVLVKSEVVKIEGRKVFFKTAVFNSKGVQCAQSEGLWIAVPRPQSKL